MERVKQNIAYKLPEAALNIIKAINVKDEYDIYSVGIIDDEIVVVRDELSNGSLVSVNGKDIKDCAEDRELQRKLYNIFDNEAKPLELLELRSVLVTQDTREDKKQNVQNKKDVLESYKFRCNNSVSRDMVVLDCGQYSCGLVALDILNVKSTIKAYAEQKKKEDDLKASAEAGFFNGADKLFAALAKNNNILADDVKKLSKLMLSSFEPQAGQ